MPYITNNLYMRQGCHVSISDPWPYHAASLSTYLPCDWLQTQSKLQLVTQLGWLST